MRAARLVGRTFLALAVCFALWQALSTTLVPSDYATAVDRLEAADLGSGGAQPATVPATAMAAEIVVQCLQGPQPRAVLVRNGVVAGRFASGRLVVAVQPGDLLAVDGRAVRQRLDFQVTYVAPELSAPGVGTAVATVGDIAVLPQVGAR